MDPGVHLAFKPTDVIDIRRFPRDEAKAIEEENTRLRDDAKPAKVNVPSGDKPVPGGGTRG